MENKITGYDLSRSYFDYCFANPEKIKPIHTAIYFFAIEHCNRLGWKEKFGFPTTMVMEAIGVKSYNTYIKSLNDLVDFGFIKMITRSTNQHSANIVALSNFNKALDKALDKALIKHSTKHSTKQHQSTHQSIDSVDKPITIKQINKEQRTKMFISIFDLEMPQAWKDEIKSLYNIGDRTLGYDIIDFQDWYQKSTNNSRTMEAWKDKLFEWIGRNNAKKPINPQGS